MALSRDPSSAPLPSSPVAVLARTWWAVVLRGLAAIAFGVLALLLPGVTLAALVLLFGAWALVDGVFNLVSAVRDARAHRHWVALLLESLASIAAGVITFAVPGLTALLLLIVIGAWAVVTGVFEIAAAIRLRRHITGEWRLALGGIVSVAFGVLLLAVPALGALAMIAWIGAYAIVFGLLLVALGVRLRRWGATGRTVMSRAA